MHIANKTKENAFGFGAIFLYCAVIALIAGGVYGFAELPMPGTQSAGTTKRPTTGKLTILTGDRVRCEQFSFDNETQQLMSQGVSYCDENWKKLEGPSPSVAGIRNAFRGQ